MIKGIVIGDNIIVPPGIERIVSINRDDVEYTSDDDGKMFIGANCVIDEDGIITATKATQEVVKTGDFDTDPIKDFYACDASGGNITATLTASRVVMYFVKTDASANTVILSPASGLINGAATYTLTTQFQKVTLLFDGTDFYV